MQFIFPQLPNVPQVQNLGDLPIVPIPQNIPVVPIPQPVQPVQFIPIVPNPQNNQQEENHKKTLMELTKENLKIISSKQTNEHKFKEIFKNFNIKFDDVEIDIDLIKSSFNLINHLIELNSLKTTDKHLFIMLKLLIIKLIDSDLNGVVAYAANVVFNKMVVDDLIYNIKEQKDNIKNKCDLDFNEAEKQLSKQTPFKERQQLNHIKATTTLLKNFVDDVDFNTEFDLLNDLKQIFYYFEYLTKCDDYFIDDFNCSIDSFLFGYYDPFNDVSDIEEIAEGLHEELTEQFEEDEEQDEETEEVANMLLYFIYDFKYDFKRLIESGYTPEEVTNELNLNHMYEMIDYYFESIDDDLLKEFERLLNNIRFGVLSSIYKID